MDISSFHFATSLSRGNIVFHCRRTVFTASVVVTARTKITSSRTACSTRPWRFNTARPCFTLKPTSGSNTRLQATSHCCCAWSLDTQPDAAVSAWQCLSRSSTSTAYVTSAARASASAAWLTWSTHSHTDTQHKACCEAGQRGPRSPTTPCTPHAPLTPGMRDVRWSNGQPSGSWPCAKTSGVREGATSTAQPSHTPVLHIHLERIPPKPHAQHDRHERSRRNCCRRGQRLHIGTVGAHGRGCKPPAHTSSSNSHAMLHLQLMPDAHSTNAQDCQLQSVEVLHPHGQSREAQL